MSQRKYCKNFVSKCIEKLTYGSFIEVCVDVGEKVHEQIYIILLALSHVVHQEDVKAEHKCHICVAFGYCSRIATAKQDAVQILLASNNLYFHSSIKSLIH